MLLLFMRTISVLLHSESMYSALPGALVALSLCDGLMAAWQSPWWVIGSWNDTWEKVLSFLRWWCHPSFPRLSVSYPSLLKLLSVPFRIIKNARYPFLYAIFSVGRHLGNSSTIQMSFVTCDRVMWCHDVGASFGWLPGIQRIIRLVTIAYPSLFDGV